MTFGKDFILKIGYFMGVIALTLEMVQKLKNIEFRYRRGDRRHTISVDMLKSDYLGWPTVPTCSFTGIQLVEASLPSEK